MSSSRSKTVALAPADGSPAHPAGAALPHRDRSRARRLDRACDGPLRQLADVDLDAIARVRFDAPGDPIWARHRRIGRRIATGRAASIPAVPTSGVGR